jgi:hypothetical protein
MSPIGEPRQLLLWQILTGSQKAEETLQDVYLELKEEILKIRVITPKPTGIVPVDSPDIYISREVREGRILRFGISMETNKRKELGSNFISSLKEIDNEDANYLSYEHLFAENIGRCDLPLVLVGAHGSGKTFKLSYIWYKYIERLSHCDDKNCLKKERVRILIDVLNEDFRTAEEFYRFVYKTIITLLQRDLGKRFLEIYREYSHFLIEEFNARRNLSFFPTLSFLGLRIDNIPGPTDYIGKVRRRKELQELVTFSLCFCAWVERKYYPNRTTCIFALFDNIDGAPDQVQRAVFGLLEKSEIGLPMVCACRPETLRNWNYDAIPLIIVPHIGPTGYDVVMSRLKIFLENINEEDLRDKLKGIMDKEVFIDNLKYIYAKLESWHFERFFKNLFGWQIRQALRFSQGIIDAAASRTTEALKEAVEGKSVYALERIIYRPWGLKSPKLRVVNIFQQGREKRYRLAGLRVLIYLNRAEEPSYSVKDVYRELAIFGFSQVDVINILESMVKNRLIVSATREGMKLGSYNTCKNELVRLTEMGHGLWSASYELGYIETVMLYCYCDGSLYDGLGQDEMGLLDTLRVVRIFLKESSEIEMNELDNVFVKRHMKRYHNGYGNQTIVLEILGNILVAVVKIACSEKRKGGRRVGVDRSSDIFEVARDFESEIIDLQQRIIQKFGFEPPLSENLLDAIETLDNETKKPDDTET